MNIHNLQQKAALSALNNVISDLINFLKLCDGEGKGTALLALYDLQALYVQLTSTKEPHVNDKI